MVMASTTSRTVSLAHSDSVGEAEDHQRGRLAKGFMAETITFILITSGIPIKVVLEGIVAAAWKASEKPAVKPDWA